MLPKVNVYLNQNLDHLSKKTYITIKNIEIRKITSITLISRLKLKTSSKLY